MALFSIQGLTFAYPNATTPALQDISLDVQAGEYLCLFGRSGCGKTTLLRSLKTALVPHGERKGVVLFDGVPLDEVPAHCQAARIGFVMQDPESQIVTDKVWHELAFGLENLGCPPQEMRLRVAEVATFFGMEKWFHRDTADLSGGQKQMVNLASVMALQPDVLILDEPTAQLDPLAAEAFLDMVAKLNRQLGTTVVVAGHRLEEVFAVADRAVALDAGRIACAGLPRYVATGLLAADDPSASALPVAARVHHGVTGGLQRPDEPMAQANPQEAGGCPLSVREGRRWLAQQVTAHPPSARELSEEPAIPRRGEPALQMRGAWFRYGRDERDVLAGVDLDIHPGCILALLGGNGTGKTTLLKCLCGIAKPQQGKVRFSGQSLEKQRRRGLLRGGIALLPQDPRSLFAKKTVRAELEEMLDAHGDLPSPRRSEGIRAPRLGGAAGCDALAGNAAVDGTVPSKEKLVEVVALCGLEGLLERHPYDLSGGEQQRVALAKVLLTEPQVLLLDEPAKGLDSAFKQQLAEILRTLAQGGTAMVLVSHDVELCALCADEAALFFDGRVIARDTPRRLFSTSAFYTTAASRMSRGIFANAITEQDVVALCLS